MFPLAKDSKIISSTLLGSRLKNPMRASTFFLTTSILSIVMFGWFSSTISLANPSFSSLRRLNFYCSNMVCVTALDLLFPKVFWSSTPTLVMMGSSKWVMSISLESRFYWEATRVPRS